ncbi:uncharacterized protein METZ01_LOCUS305538 [marine metagenome]|uniref:Uncharacterized protein n=1 Tax=marine metagenome TaxID=408172 RepID=A0A382MUM9_9ZZZZ
MGFYGFEFRVDLFYQHQLLSADILTFYHLNKLNATGVF